MDLLNLGFEAYIHLKFFEMKKISQIGFLLMALSSVTHAQEIMSNDQNNASRDGAYGVFVGKYSGSSTLSGDTYNVFFGYKSGQNTNGDGNVFIGNFAGQNYDGSNILMIDNGFNGSSWTTYNSNPLIWGDFSSDIVKINGSFEVTGSLTFPSGSLNSTMILDGTIVNGDINSSAAIAASKLQTTVIVEGENVSLLANDAGYLTSSGLYDGSNNIAIGNGAYTSGSGQTNIAVGRNAMNGATGDYNITLGYDAFNGSDGDHNIAIGRQTLSSGNTGYNIAIGYQALRYFDYSGKRNVAMGYQAMVNNASGGGNTGIGDNALQNNVTGDNNTALGYLSGPGSSYTSLTNTTALGYGATVSSSNSVVIGNSSITSIGGQVSWSTLSDGRFKTVIKEEVPGLTFIRNLRPVAYRVDRSKLAQHLGEIVTEEKKMPPSQVTTGFIAQEVEALVKKEKYNFSGVHTPENENGQYSIRYAEFVVPLTKAVQELSAMVEEQQATILGLKEEVAKLREEKPTTMEKSTAPTLGSKAFQNRPNPFSNGTKIDVQIGMDVQKARLVVYNMQGQELKSFDLREKGVSTIEISRADLSNGLYFYALVADGVLVETHKMVIE